MGSLPSTPSPELFPSGHLVYVPFCHRDPALNAGAASNWIECYDPSSNSWCYVSLIPHVVEGHVLKGFAMVSVGDMIYVIGGRLCHREMAHVSDELADWVDVEVEILSTVMKYDARTERWSLCAPLGTPRSDFACTVSDNKIYVAGGQSNLGCARGVSSAEVYDPILDEWSPLPDMNTMRYKSVGVTWQGKIHVVSGFVERLDSDRASPFITERSSAEVFDPRTGTWELMATMWQLDVPPNQIVEVDGKLFSSGDCLKAWKGHIEAYDAELNMWNAVENSCHREMSQDSQPIKRLYLTMAPIGTHLYFLRGYRFSGEAPQTVSMACKFDTSPTAAAAAWTNFEPIVEATEKELCSHCCVVKLL
ncbi:F-box/kelch-repeat protein At1g16250-like [Rhodamnia argentea]|uniref:F-box/kelch-repeat protein At1g16250-like n=1 Tax=Rhodamnia argentea TaxID=178133 RepID=A0A8B8QBB8_9MYRT|nr:F-box/kelch-repeat protein At1g16250-like [Rhodamnia argentea]